jgi:hypothetical protein
LLVVWHVTGKPSRILPRDVAELERDAVTS